MNKPMCCFCNKPASIFIDVEPDDRTGESKVYFCANHASDNLLAEELTDKQKRNRNSRNKLVEFLHGDSND